MYVNHELDWIRDALVHQNEEQSAARERGEEVHPRIALRRSLLYLVYMIILRIANPGRYPNDDTRVRFEQLWVINRDIERSSGDYQGMDQWSDTDFNLTAAIQDRYLPAARLNDDINPGAAAVSRGILQRLQHRMTTAAEALHDTEVPVDDRTLIGNLRMAFEHGRHDWSQEHGISERQSTNSLSLLDTIDNLLAIVAIPVAPRDSGLLQVDGIQSQFTSYMEDVQGLSFDSLAFRSHLLRLVPVAETIVDQFEHGQRHLWEQWTHTQRTKKHLHPKLFRHIHIASDYHYVRKQSVGDA